MSNKFYSYGKQSIDQHDINAVIDVLKGDWLTQGPLVEKFESDLCNKLQANYCSAVTNGTASLHLIGMGLGWKKGDIVLTTPITFLASANCILYSAATPDFVDIDPVSYTLDINKLEHKIISFKQKNKKIKAVIGVDYGGHPCDWENLRYLANKYQFQLVNDFCHALGAEYKQEIGYGVKYADAVNLSFHPVKHITTGEGGAVITNSKELDAKIKLLRTHGITRDTKILEKNEGPWYYEMHFLGYNYRITDFQCALGSSQLKKLDDFISKRNSIADYYNTIFGDDERFILPSVSKLVKHAFHLFPLQIKFEQINYTKKKFFEDMRASGIGLQVHYIPVHLQPYYRKNFGYKLGDFPVAEEFYRREVSLPIYPSLESHDVELIGQRIREYGT